MTQPAEWLCNCLPFELPKFSRMGRLAAWYCDSCTSDAFEGRIACPKCCGFTADLTEVRDARTEAGL